MEILFCGARGVAQLLSQRRFVGKLLKPPSSAAVFGNDQLISIACAPINPYLNLKAPSSSSAIGSRSFSVQ
jgi:hypothetical protein